MNDFENQMTSQSFINKIILMTNFRTMVPETIETINHLNDVIESLGFKLILLSTSVSQKLNCSYIKIPFSFKDYSTIKKETPDLQFYNENLLTIDAEFNDDDNPDKDLYKKGIQNCITIAHQIARNIKPALVLLWSAAVPQSVIFKNVFAEYFIPVLFIERGLLPETLMYDETGQGTFSKMRCNNILTRNNFDYIKNYERVKNYYISNKIDKHEQCEFISAEEYLQQNNIKGKKVIAFVGQWDVASGVNRNYDNQSFLNSPYFNSTLDAFNAISAVVLKQKNIVLIFKPHPFDSKDYTSTDRDRIIVDQKVNIHSLLESADVIAVMSTTVQYEALFYEKPVLLLANSFLNKFNIGYEIFCKEDLEDVIQNAILEIGLEQKVENGKRFINFITNEYLISLKDANPIKVNLRNFVSTIVTNYNLDLIEPLLPDNYLVLANQLKKIYESPPDRFDESKLISIAEKFIIKNEIVEARKILLNILNNINPESIDAANSYAVSEIMSGNYVSAEELLLQILAKDPTNEIAIDNYNYLKQIITHHSRIAEKINEE